MCGRYVSTTSLQDLADVYEVDDVRTDALETRYNVAPSQPIYAVVDRRGEGKGPTRLLGAFRWGLVPSWARDTSIANKLINARSEGIGDKPAFRSALLRRRCVIPADAFYEWQVRADVDGATSRGRLPWAIRRADRRPMSFAGLWEVWRDPADPTAPPVRSATIVTTAANERLAALHHRMPVVLDGPALDAWLDPGLDDAGVLRDLLVPAPDDGWETWAVGTRVNAVANEGPELLDPLPA